MIIAVGVDLGKKRDPAAIVITELQAVCVDESGQWVPAGRREDKVWTSPPMPDTLYLVRAIEHVQLGTSYPKIGRRINTICSNLRRQQSKARIHLAMDATGVGAGPVDIVRELIDHSIHLTAVSYTATDKCPPAPLLRFEVNVGKAYLVVRGQTILQKRLLQMPQGPITAALVDELLTFEVKTAANGHDTYNAHEGKHDDLVNALLLSLLGDAHGMDVTTGPRIYT